MARPSALRPWIECQNPFKSWPPSNHRRDRRRIAKTAKNKMMASRRWFCCAMVMKHAPFEMVFGVEAVDVNEIEVPLPRSCLLFYRAFFLLRSCHRLWVLPCPTSFFSWDHGLTRWFGASSECLKKVGSSIWVSLFCTSCTERVKLYHQVKILMKH